MRAARMFNAIRRASSRRVRPRTSLILGPVADVRGRGATGFQVRIELPAKSHLRDHFLVAWIMFQLARAESREGAAPSFRKLSTRRHTILFVRISRFYD